MNIVFLGGGRITSAMLAGLRMVSAKHHFTVHDRNARKLRSLKKLYRVDVEPDLERALAKADMLVIAVRPGSVVELLQSIDRVCRHGVRPGRLRCPSLIVSLAAGIPLGMLTRALGAPVRWARAMPSPVCRSGRGLTALTFASPFSGKDRHKVRNFFAVLGPVVEIPERKFDVFTVTFSCSHGYQALAALAKAAQDAGLDRKTALLAGAHALADGIVAWRAGKHSLEALLEEAATPGGIAATTAAAMDAAGYGRAVNKGVAAGLRRARANARGSERRSTSVRKL
jgi:pyrroline-5-carboxylate reductase